MKKAPLFSDIAAGRDDGAAWWLDTDDGVRIRVGLWHRAAEKGTVLLFPGRTEYVEKYGRTAADLADRGYATLAVDWRGQGLADRLVRDVMAGHVISFSDYQRDVASVLAAAETLDLPRPWHLLGHSMGGCIGLRAAIKGLPVASCAFSAPMWGIQMTEAMRVAAWSASWTGRKFGFGHVISPGVSAKNYVLSEPFETNKLTNDPEFYQFMIDQNTARPELGIGGPSLQWIYEALTECRALLRLPSPELPCLTIMGSDEQIVDPQRVHDRMGRWPGGALEIIETGKHELLMDNARIRTGVIDSYCAHFDSAGRATDPASRPAADGRGRKSQAS